MNEGFPPVLIGPSETRPRRKEKGRTSPLPPEILARRREIAGVLRAKVEVLSEHLQSLSPAQRRAVFYKLEHETGIDPTAALSGTDLKPISQPSPNIVFAVPKSGNLDRLVDKVDEFASSPIKSQHVKNEWLARLSDIVEADPKDRLSSDLRQRYQALSKGPALICEIEFLSLKRSAKQQKAEIEEWIGELQRAFGSGVNGNFFEHEILPPICRAVIRCPGAMFKRLVEEPLWIQRIRWIESRPRFQTFTEVFDSFRFQDLAKINSPARDAPIICVIDSGVTEGNPFLARVVRKGMAKSFLARDPRNPNDEHGHGSAVASLASYYSINLAAGAVNSPRTWIANARILNASNQIEDDRLFSSVLEEAVSYFVKKGVRIFCLAVGDDRKIWSDSTRRTFPRKSWIARRIDQISRKYDVVFVTCTGNLTCAEISEFINDGNSYPTYFADETSRILDPGHAALAVTVGSIAPSTIVTAARDNAAIAMRNQPSPFTRCGPGIKREIKPELVEYGGNLAVDNSMGRVRENRGLQVVAASKQLSPAAGLWTGTSFAVPRVAYKLSLIDQDLRSLGLDPSATLLRAFLVNSASHREENGELSDLRDSLATEGSVDRTQLLIGYGLPDHDRATSCDDYSVVTFYQGTIEADRVVFFDIPVPRELANSNGERRLTVTVAHAPEVQKWGLEQYFGADLKWRVFRGDKARHEIVDAMSESSEEDESSTGDSSALPKELPFRPTLMTRSRGTVQHASYLWSQHKKEYSAANYTLAVSASKKWTRKVRDIPIGIVIRLEDLGKKVPIYTRVRTQVEIEV